MLLFLLFMNFNTNNGLSIFKLLFAGFSTFIVSCGKYVKVNS